MATRTKAEACAFNVSKRWRKELCASAERVLILSPYLTSPTAESVISCVSDPSLCEVHTLFAPEVFAQGSSSLTAIQRLVARGVRVFSLAGLHAKVVIAGDRFLSVGSQNVTNGGARNREATILITDRATVQFFTRQIENRWLRSSTPINTAMIADMAASLKGLRRLLNPFKAAARAAGIEIQNREQERQAVSARNAEKAQRALAARRERERRTELVWKQMPRASERIHVSTVRQGNTSSLVPRDITRDFTLWTANGETVHLDRLSRYLCVATENWKLGFARVAKKCITFIHHDRYFSALIAGRRCHFFLDTRKPSAESNLCCRLDLAQNEASIELRAWFDLKRVELVGAPIVTDGDTPSSEIKARNWVNAHKRAIERTIEKIMPKPFIFGGGYSLRGTKPHKFFNLPARVVKLGFTGGLPFLVVEARTP